MNKVIVYLQGWLFSEKFRYLTYVWTTNTSQGQGAQVVVAGNLGYHFNEHLGVYAGIGSLPGTRSTAGNFWYWLGFRRSSDRGRVLPAFVYKRHLGPRGGSRSRRLPSDARQQPEPTRCGRGTARQRVTTRWPPRLAVDADHRRIRTTGRLWRLRGSPEARHAASQFTSRGAPRTARASRAPRRSRTSSSPVRRKHRVHARPVRRGRHGQCVRYRMTSVDTGVKYEDSRSKASITGDG